MNHFLFVLLLGLINIGNVMSKIEEHYSDSEKNYADAKAYCQQWGGWLIHIYSEEYSTKITTEMGTKSIDKAWIGLSDAKTEDTWLLDKNGKEAEYVKWQPNEPNNSGDCADLSAAANKMDDTDCGLSKHFICQKVTYSSYIYHFGPTLMPWNDAKSACEKWNGHLLTIFSQKHNEHIVEMLQNRGITDAWIGIDDQAAAGTYVVHKDNTELAFYKNWANGEPKNNLHCAQISTMLTKQGTWKTEDCSKDLAYVCYKQKRTMCPVEHPYAFYKNGEKCCKTANEKTDNALGHLCNGGRLYLDSECCENDAFVPCADGLCDNYVVRVNGGYSSWSNWAYWTNGKSCGRGYRFKTRCCIKPIPEIGGSCEGEPVYIEAYYPDPPCPVDARYSQWGQWGDCSPGCSATSMKKSRTRTCNSPYAHFSGAECPSFEDEDEQSCTLVACPAGNTISSTGELHKPYCASQSACTWDATAKAKCAELLCKAAGFGDGGRFDSATNNMCETSYSTDKSFWIAFVGSEQVTYSSTTNLKEAVITATCSGDAGAVWGSWSSWTECTSTCHRYKQRCCISTGDECAADDSWKGEACDTGEGSCAPGTPQVIDSQYDCAPDCSGGGKCSQCGHEGYCCKQDTADCPVSFKSVAPAANHRCIRIVYDCATHPVHITLDAQGDVATQANLCYKMENGAEARFDGHGVLATMGPPDTAATLDDCVTLCYENYKVDTNKYKDFYYDVAGTDCYCVETSSTFSSNAGKLTYKFIT